MNKIESLLYGKNKEKIAYRVSFITILLNTLLAIVKFIAGIFSNSGAMISDAVHTLSDVLSTFIVIVGIKISRKKSDVTHRYGHERMESVASLLLATLLFITGFVICIDGINKIVDFNFTSVEVPGILALVVAIISIVSKELMFWYTKSAAKIIDSQALMADAWHHRSDALSSIGALIGIVGSKLGFPILDPIASIVIALFIGKASFDIFKDATDKLVDKSCDEEKVEEIKKLIVRQDGVLSIDDIKTRIFGNRVYVDIEIGCDGEKSLFETHFIASQVADKVEKEFKEVKHCMIHVNPFKEQK